MGTIVRKKSVQLALNFSIGGNKKRRQQHIVPKQKAVSSEDENSMVRVLAENFSGHIKENPSFTADWNNPAGIVRTYNT